MNLLLVFLCCACVPLLAELQPAHITYLMQNREHKRALKLYQEYRQQQGKHDFEVLQKLSTIILEEGAHSCDPEQQLLSLFGASLAGYSSSFDVLATCVKSPHPHVQLAAVKFLGKLHEDRSADLLIKAMHSPFFPVRLEAAYQLSVYKHPAAVGQIEALMYKVPQEARYLFPQLFALIGTAEAINVLKLMIDDSDLAVRLEAILSAGRAKRDDLLPSIRATATHLNHAEQESCAYVLGQLRDSTSSPLLRCLRHSPSPHVTIAACRALAGLGESSTSQDPLLKLAREGNVFAIAALEHISDTEELLLQLMKSKDSSIRLNAALSLLNKRDPRALPVIEEILVRDMRDLGFQPQFSVGHALMYWKVVPSCHEQAKALPYDLHTLSLVFREEVLRACIDLPEATFLSISRRILQSRQTELIPLLVFQLENLRTAQAIELLKEYGQKPGAPLTRTYCNLALMRLREKGPYSERIKNWLTEAQKTEMISFRPILPRNMQLSEAAFELTPAENARLLIEACSTLAMQHDPASIDLLLATLKEGHPKNRYVLAGLLLQAIH